MKFVLIDLTNNGVIFVAESHSVNKLKWEFNILKSCILDTHIIPIPNPSTLLNQDRVTTQFIYTHNGEFSVGSKEELNQTFLTKQNKANLIYPLISRLTQGLIVDSVRHMPEFYFPMEDTLMHEVRNSDSSSNSYSSGIIKYAQTVGMSNEEALKELSIEAETIHSLKMRTYSMAKKYENLIREVNTKEQAADLLENIEQKIFRESRI
jgi:hypothetical protein